MRRTICLSIIAIATMLGLMVPATAAQAAEPVVPVTPIPELPSNTIRMTQNATGSWTAADWWKTVFWKAAQPGTEVATIPTTGAKVATVAKPITPAATFARGASGGPLVGAFLGGFAIGQAGLQLYGSVTGDDPLDNLCGTAFEGAGHFMYIGMMPDCKPAVDSFSQGVVQTGGDLVYDGVTYVTFRITGGIAGPNNTATESCHWIKPGPNPGTISQLSGGSWGSPTGTPVTRQWGTGACASGWQPSQWPAPAVYPRWQMRSNGVTLATSTPVVAKPAAEAERKPRCTIDWEDGTTTSGVGTTYREVDGFPLSAPGLGCKSAWDAKPGAGTDLLPSRIGVGSEDDSGAITEIATQEVPDMSPEQRRALEAVPGNGRGLVLERTVDGTLKSCNTWEVDCAQWWTETGEGTTPGTYRCSFGGNTVALTECGPYRHTFDSPTTSPTITDPSTGQPVPWSGAATNPGTIADGVTGGGACGAAWSWNPVDWVLNPLKCAFIPSQAAVATATAHVATTWEAKPPQQIMNLVGGFAVPSGATGCKITVTIFADEFANELTPVDTCEGSWSSVLVPIAHLVINVAMVVLVVVLVRRQVAGMVNYQAT